MTDQQSKSGLRAGGYRVHRWRQSGHDRIRVDAAARADTATRATDLAEPPTIPPLESTPPAGPVDLSTVVPGSAVAARARALREETPIYLSVAHAFGLDTEYRAWELGAKGEQEIARRLGKLDDQWHALHSVPVGTGFIGQLVIGPGGVFAVDTKNHHDGSAWVGGDVFVVNGRPTEYVHQTRHTAETASGLLAGALGRDVAVRGVIAVVGARGGLRVNAQPGGSVTVVGCKQLARWLRTQPAVLSPAAVADVYALACRPQTWQQT